MGKSTSEIRVGGTVPLDLLENIRQIETVEPVGTISQAVELRVRVVEEREDQFEVDLDWVMPQLTGLVPDGGRLDQETRKLDNTYFDTPGFGLLLFGVTLRRRVGGSETGLAVEGSQRDNSHGTAEQLAHEDAAAPIGEGRGRSASG
jgi:hypothetical protein